MLNNIENTSAVNGTIILYIEVGGGASVGGADVRDVTLYSSNTVPQLGRGDAVHHSA